MKLLLYLIMPVVIGFSVIAFAAYGLDKRRAQNGGRRIPEKGLHLMALLGGWPGALAGQRTFRHKTRKLRFQILFWLCVLLNMGIVAGLFWVQSKLA